MLPFRYRGRNSKPSSEELCISKDWNNQKMFQSFTKSNSIMYDCWPDLEEVFVHFSQPSQASALRLGLHILHILAAPQWLRRLAGRTRVGQACEALAVGQDINCSKRNSKRSVSWSQDGKVERQPIWSYANWDFSFRVNRSWACAKDELYIPAHSMTPALYWQPSSGTMQKPSSVIIRILPAVDNMFSNHLRKKLPETVQCFFIAEQTWVGGEPQNSRSGNPQLSNSQADFTCNSGSMQQGSQGFSKHSRLTWISRNYSVSKHQDPPYKWMNTLGLGTISYQWYWRSDRSMDLWSWEYMTPWEFGKIWNSGNTWWHPTWRTVCMKACAYAHFSAHLHIQTC